MASLLQTSEEMSLCYKLKSSGFEGVLLRVRLCGTNVLSYEQLDSCFHLARYSLTY